MVRKTGFETEKKRSVRNFREAAEIPQFLTDVEQKNKKGVRRDGENLLKYESGKEAGKRIIPFAAEALIKGVMEGRRDKIRDIKMFFKEPEEGGGYRP